MHKEDYVKMTNEPEPYTHGIPIEDLMKYAIKDEIKSVELGLEAILKHPDTPTALERERQLRNELSRLYKKYYDVIGEHYKEK